MSLGSLPWLGSHLTAQHMGPKRGRHFQPTIVELLCLPRGLQVCWEVVPVLKASPMSYSMPCGLQACLSFWFLAAGLSLVLRKQHLSCFILFFFFSESDEIKERITWFGVIIKSTDSGITQTHV